MIGSLEGGANGVSDMANYWSGKGLEDDSRHMDRSVGVDFYPLDAGVRVLAGVERAGGRRAGKLSGLRSAESANCSPEPASSRGRRRCLSFMTDQLVDHSRGNRPQLRVIVSERVNGDAARMIPWTWRLHEVPYAGRRSRGADRGCRALARATLGVRGVVDPQSLRQSCRSRRGARINGRRRSPYASEGIRSAVSRVRRNGATSNWRLVIIGEGAESRPCRHE